MYSNTGGQMSKATVKSTSIKFAVGGKRETKKDMGAIAMSYGNVFVASLSLGADYNQTLKALNEGEHYNGTALFLCLAPCIDWGFDSMSHTSQI